MQESLKQKVSLRWLHKILRGLGLIWSKFTHFLKNHKIWSTLIALALIAAIIFSVLHRKQVQTDSPASTEATVEQRDIKSVITGSSTIEPNKEYSITPLVSGEITEAPFEEGDVVTKGQLLYKFDTGSMETNIASADISIRKAQQSYQDTIDEVNDSYIISDVSGTVSEVFVENGDSVGSGTKIASISDTSVLKARIPFNASDSNKISVGDSAVLTLVGTGSILSGNVTQISSASQTTNGHMSICYVTIEAANPGALSSGDSVTAMIGSIACNDIGSFEPVEKKTITAKASGTLTNLYISESDAVHKGSTIGVIDTDSDSKIYSAELSLEESMLSKEKLETQLEDYSITAPISGTIITKNLTVGDTYEMNNSSVSELALIYDMSSLCFTLSIDELDVKNVKIGQSVKITADASDTVYSGVVENVSISGTTSNGVTTYPAKVRITEFDEYLLPGMNIEAEITVQNAENVLTVPINAVNRGNIVYVKGDKTDENDRAPEGFYSVQVTTGISDDEYVEIVSGLSEGNIVYVKQQTTEASSEGNSNNERNNNGGMPGGGMPGGMGGGAPGGGGGAGGRSYGGNGGGR